MIFPGIKTRKGHHYPTMFAETYYPRIIIVTVKLQLSEIVDDNESMTFKADSSVRLLVSNTTKYNTLGLNTKFLTLPTKYSATGPPMTD